MLKHWATIRAASKRRLFQRPVYLRGLRSPPSALDSGSVLFWDGFAAPLAALPAAPLSRPLILGAKVGLEVVPPMATGMPLRRADPATPPIAPPAPLFGIMPINWPAMPPAPAAAPPLLLPPPRTPVSLRMTL